MHYKNGREAHDGDPVVTKFSDKVVAGVIHSLQPAQSTCNGQIAFIIPGGTVNWCVTAGECFHAEDAYNAMDQAMKNPAVEVPPAKL